MLSSANHIFTPFAITSGPNHPAEDSLLNAFLNVNNLSVVTSKTYREGGVFVRSEGKHHLSLVSVLPGNLCDCSGSKI